MTRIAGVHDVCDRFVPSGVRIILKAIADVAEGLGLTADLPHVFPVSPTRETSHFAERGERNSRLVLIPFPPESILQVPTHAYSIR
jgi:hypothetical protein